jgi:hypothetical protein
MNTSTHPNRGFFFAVTLLLIAGLVVLGLGNVTELSALHPSGIVAMGAVVVVSILAVAPAVLFLAWLE